MIKVAACQVPDIRQDMDASMNWIKKFCVEADAEDVSLICFPECFLQGYLTEKKAAEKYAIDLSATALFKQLTAYKTVIVLGMIEKENGLLFNTAVVIRHGKLIGKYRKTHLLDGEKIFTAGNEYPILKINDLLFGINICYDTQFPESSAGLAGQGAQLILCPSNNMMRYATAEKYKYLHHEMRIQRAKENKMWLISADVTGERDGRISYGPTSAINPSGEVVAQVPSLQTGMIIVNI